MNSSDRETVEVKEKNKSFLEINQQAFTELLTFVDFVDEKLNIGFVEVNFAQDRDVLIEALIKNQNCQNIQFEVLDFLDPDLRFLRDELVAALKQIKVAPDKKLVLLITDLEKSIGALEEYPPVLTNLNFIRDDLRHSACHPMILFLPNYALTRLAKYAPDFWAWRRKVFYFKTLKSTFVTSVGNEIFYDGNIDNLKLSEEKDRIDMLLRLLSEYSSPDSQDNKQNLPSIINTYNELSIAYRILGNYQEAINCAKQSLKIAQKIGDSKSEANSLGNLGNAYYSMEKYQQAIECDLRSLEIFQQIDDRRGTANSLRNLGITYSYLGEYQRAIEFFQHSLEIFQQINDRRGTANSLRNLGITYSYLGEYQQAIDFYQYSLKIFQHIGDRYSEANSLISLGDACFFLKEYQQAIDFYQYSLEIFQHIGDRYGEANSLISLGLTCKELGQKLESKAAFENASKLYKAMGLDKQVDDCNKAIQDLEISSSNQQNVN